MESVKVTCSICKNNKILSQSSNLYYVGTKENMNQNIICEDCYPAEQKRIDESTKNINFGKAALYGIITAIAGFTAFYPIYHLVQHADAVMKAILVLGLFPALGIAYAIFFGSGRKSGIQLMLLYLVTTYLFYGVFLATYVLQELVTLLNESGIQTNLIDLVRALLANPTSRIHEVLRQAIFSEMLSLFSFINYVMFLIPLFLFSKGKIHKVL